MAKGKYVTEDKFNKIKALLKAGVSSKQIQQWEDVSEETVRRVGKADTYDEYKANTAYRHMKKDNDVKQEQLSFEQMEDDDNQVLVGIYHYLQSIYHLLRNKEMAEGERQ